jgi:hypothetical protein
VRDGGARREKRRAGLKPGGATNEGTYIAVTALGSEAALGVAGMRPLARLYKVHTLDACLKRWA